MAGSTGKIVGLAAAAGIIGVLILGAIGSQVHDSITPEKSSKASTTASPPAASSKAAAPSPAAPVVRSWGNGMWAVPGDIPKGVILVTVVPKDVISCYWEIDKSMENTPDAIVNNGNLEPGAKGRFKVPTNAQQIILSGGCTWKVGK